MINEIKSNCSNCGGDEFNQTDRTWSGEGNVYCKCGQELQWVGYGKIGTNAAGWNINN